MSENQPSVPMTGSLAPGVLPDVLRSLYVERRTGMLHFTRGEERGSVCFIKGNILYGGANIKECLMGETLVRHGLISPSDLDRALEAGALTGKRLGETLLELGFLDKEGHEDALALHVREILLCVFSWTEGAYAFEGQDAEAFRGYDQPLRLSTADVILDAVWSVHDPEVVRRALGDLDRVLVLPADPLLRFQRVALTPTDGFLLSRVDGTLTAREILDIAPVGREEAERSLFGLLCTGMAEYGSAPSPKEEKASPHTVRRAILEAYAGLATRDHFEVLGVPRTAADEELKAAYFRLAKAFHPDARHDPALADLRDKIEAVFARLNEAYQVLSDREERARYEGTLQVVRPAASPAPEAPPTPSPDPGQRVEEELARADESFAQGRYWDAFQIADAVLPMATGKLRQRARLLKAKVYLKNPSWRKQAEEELRAAVQEDRSNVDAYYLLGTLYKAAGAEDKARAMFRRVLSLKPRHPGALAELGPEPSEDRSRGGLLKKLLTRS